MDFLQKTISDGLVLALLCSVYLMLALKINPRTFLQDYPQEIQNMVPPKSEQEKKLSLIIGLPFIALLILFPFFSTLALKQQMAGQISFFNLAIHAFGVAFLFNAVDWLVLDWLIFCTLTPKFLIIPGSEGAQEYRNYRYHFIGFLKGSGLTVGLGLVIAVIVAIL
jgi:hypothetical protein